MTIIDRLPTLVCPGLPADATADELSNLAVDLTLHHGDGSEARMKVYGAATTTAAVEAAEAFFERAGLDYGVSDWQAR